MTQVEGDEGDTNSASAAVSLGKNGISTFFGALPSCHKGDTVFPVGNCRTYTIGIALVPFDLGYIVKTCSLWKIGVCKSLCKKKRGRSSGPKGAFFSPATVTNVTNASTIDSAAYARCVKIPSFTQTKYEKNLQPMNFGAGLNDVASRNVLSILTHTKSMEMAHVEHVLTLSAIQKTHSNTSMRLPTLIVFLWKIFQSVRKLKKSA